MTKSNKKDEKYLADYYLSQTEISARCELYGQNMEHTDKILMLFAEIFSFLCDEFSVETVKKLIMNYTNSDSFKRWFWMIKHRLGVELQKDPNFDEIGKWIGKGIFLKIVYNILIFNRPCAEELKSEGKIQWILQKAMDKQKKLLKELLKTNYYPQTGKKAVDPIPDGYILLDEVIFINLDNPMFRNCMLI